MLRSVINKNACREYLIHRADMKWPGKYKRVSKDVFDFLEVTLMLKMDSFVFSHPSVGRTLSMGVKHRTKKENA